MFFKKKKCVFLSEHLKYSGNMVVVFRLVGNIEKVHGRFQGQ